MELNEPTRAMPFDIDLNEPPLPSPRDSHLSSPPAPPPSPPPPPPSRPRAAVLLDINAAPPIEPDADQCLQSMNSRYAYLSLSICFCFFLFNFEICLSLQSFDLVTEINLVTFTAKLSKFVSTLFNKC